MTFWDEIKRRGLLSDNFDPKTEIDLLDIESGGSVNDTDDGEGPDGEGLPGTASERRNQSGDHTSEADGHDHTLQANGETDVVTDPDTGMSHFHTWEEFGIRTSVDDAHSHILLVRAAAGSHVGAEKPAPEVQEDVNSSEGISPQSAQAAGSSEQINTISGL